MAETVDDIMARCPLKHEVRDLLWVPYARKVCATGHLSKYLTLYSPPMMDIKHLHSNGLLRLDSESYQGVVAVTYDSIHYAEAMTRSGGRPALLLSGDIDCLLTQEDRADAKRLRDEFPFQVINLDYTNSLFNSANRRPVSAHLEAIEEIVRLQHRSSCNEFALFLTTRSDQGDRHHRSQFTHEFLRDLSKRIDANLRENTEFAQSFRRHFGEARGKTLLAERYDSFVPLGIAKLVAGILAQHSYEIASADGRLLVRDGGKHVRSLLHLAFQVQAAVLPRASKLRALGRPRAFYFERTLAEFVDKIGNGSVTLLKESADRRRLQTKHGKRVRELAMQTLNLPVPEPRSRDQN
jgi:hypothetical protein